MVDESDRSVSVYHTIRQPTVETIQWRPVTKGRIGVDAPPPHTKVLARLDDGEIVQLRTRLADGWLGVNVAYWCYPADRHLSR